MGDEPGGIDGGEDMKGLTGHTKESRLYPVDSK